MPPKFKGARQRWKSICQAERVLKVYPLVFASRAGLGSRIEKLLSVQQETLFCNALIDWVASRTSRLRNAMNGVGESASAAQERLEKRLKRVAGMPLHFLDKL